MAEETVTRPLAAQLRINRRSVQIALGVFWIIAAGLKFQPKMFGTSFVAMMINPMAAGQPGFIAASITHIGNFLSHEVAMWVTVFGLIELAIGVGLLFKRTVKAALVLSFAWAIGVSWFGEGFGMVFTGHSSPLTGGPGAVFLYAVIGALVWPSPDRDPDGQRTGVASSAAGRGPFGATGARAVWAGLWVFEAVLWMFPSNRIPNAIHDQLTETAGGQPGWYGHFLNSLGHAFVGAGAPVAVILAAASLIIGIGPLVSRRASVFIGLGAGLAVLYWVTGEAVGQLLTGMGSDPSNGPLVVLLGLAILPTVPEPADAPVPATAPLLAPSRLGHPRGGRPGRRPGRGSGGPHCPHCHGGSVGGVRGEDQLVVVVVRLGLHARHVDVRLVGVRLAQLDRRRFGHQGLDIDDGHGIEFGHGRYGRPRRDRPELEVHRPAPSRAASRPC